MLQRSIILFIALSAILISCGPGKKLQLAESQVGELQKQNKELAGQVNTLNSQVATLNKQTTELSSRNQSMAEEYTRYKETCEECKEDLAAIREVLNEEAETLERVREKIEKALVDFENRGVDVYSKDGLVFVSLSDELLYKSGSAKLGENGKKALGTLAEVLNDYPKLKVIVVGNTDDVQSKKGGSNWTLSTERANGVVRVLSENYKVDPVRLTAAGKSKYNPVTGNETAEGRAKNRRIDIVLNPDLGRIWESAQSEK